MTADLTPAQAARLEAIEDIAEDMEIHSEEVGRGEGDLNALDLERYVARLRAAIDVMRGAADDGAIGR